MNPTIARITLRSLLGRARSLLLIPFPLLLIGLAVLGHAVADPSDNDWPNAVLGGLGFGVVIPVLSLIVGSAVLGSEIDDGTIVHILTKPISRTEIVLTKLAVASAVTVVVNAATMVIAGAIVSGGRFALGMAVGAAVSSIVYCALFLAFSVLTKRPVLIGLVYILIWEGLLTGLLSGTRSLSIRAYGETIANHAGDTTLLAATIALPTAIVMAAVVTAAATWLASYRLSRFVVVGETS